MLVDRERFGMSRDGLLDALQRENIEARRYFWPPVHRQKIYRGVWDGTPLPVTDSVSDNVLSLPIYSSLLEEQLERVCDAIGRAFEAGRSGRSIGAPAV